jgi:hypothetical protein
MVDCQRVCCNESAVACILLGCIITQRAALHSFDLFNPGCPDGDFDCPVGLKHPIKHVVIIANRGGETDNQFVTACDNCFAVDGLGVPPGNVSSVPFKYAGGTRLRVGGTPFIGKNGVKEGGVDWTIDAWFQSGGELTDPILARIHIGSKIPFWTGVHIRDK